MKWLKLECYVKLEEFNEQAFLKALYASGIRVVDSLTLKEVE